MDSAASTPSFSSRLLRWTVWLSSAFLVIVLVSVAGLGIWLRSAARAALPQLDGTVQLTGLAASVSVDRDEHGTPHITAESQQDLWTAQGYVTASDRLWQMDALRRNASGELAEILGPSLVEHDKAQRVLGFRSVAERIYTHLDAANRARLDAYARGVNLYIDSHPHQLPPEFRLLFYRPRPWTGVDSVSIGLMMVQMLDTHFEDKLGRLHVEQHLRRTTPNAERLMADLYPVGSWRDHPPNGRLNNITAPHALVPEPIDEDEDRTQSAQRLPAELRKLLGLPVDQAPGSNNWVVSGSRTASGKPLLANDMHLALMTPNIWYMADLAAAGYHAAGVTVPGMPFVVEGHNEHVAWGMTALYADVQDLYEEKLDGKGHYEGNDAQWHPLTVEHELIHVRGSADIHIDVESTNHGPLLGPMLGKSAHTLALKWTLYDPSLNTLPIYEVNTAASAADLDQRLGAWCWPTLNMVFADDAGHIGYHAVGRVPLRWGGRGIFTLPIPHETLNPRYEWGLGVGRPLYIAYDQMPHVFDPPAGFVATANANVTIDSEAPPLTDEWVEPYRVERIYKLLGGRSNLTATEMLATQTDIYSEVNQELAHRFASAIEHTEGTDQRLRQAAQLLREWDGRMSVDSAAASIVAHTRVALWPMLLEPRLGKDASYYKWSESTFALEEIVMRATPDWLPKGQKNWDTLLTEAVRRGMVAGRAPADPARWAYGRWHVVDLEHPLGNMLPSFLHLAGTGPQPLSGDNTTVKQVGRAFGPSQRFIMDWSNVDGSTQNIVLGESGNPFSDYFSDQWHDWYNGSTFAMPFTPAAVNAHTRHALRLIP